MIIDPPAPHLPTSALYQTILGYSSEELASIFKGPPTEIYILRRWTSIFQVIEAEEINKPMLSPEGISRVKGEALKPPDSTLTLDETIP